MKLYVDELPKKCAECPFYKLDTYVDVYGYQTNSHECVLDGSMLTNSCPLQSVADYTKQVRKEVVQEIMTEFDTSNMNQIDEKLYPPTQEAILIGKGFKACKDRLFKKLDEIEQGEIK